MTTAASPGPGRFRRTLAHGLRLLPEFLLISAIVFGAHWYQTRSLLPADAAAAPAFRLETLDGGYVELSDLRGRPTLLYFFAPWCRICAASADNIRRLRAAIDADQLDVVMIALSYDDRGSVRTFALQHELTVPVLLGTPATASDFQIPGFPTYYVLDSNNAIVSRDYGYTTYPGLRLRTFLVD